MAPASKFRQCISHTHSFCKLGLTATLVDRRRRVQHARQSFEADVGVATADAPAAAAALSEATAQAFDLLLPWLEEALAAALARPAG